MPACRRSGSRRSAPPTEARRTLDLDAYLRRIGYSGDRAATLKVLRSIVAHHTERIPFENLNPLLRLAVRLDLPSLEEKIVQGGRGGYCFEQNLLLAHALTSLGFRVQGLAARVLWNAPAGARAPRGHMVLLVELDARQIVDVGFGGQTFTGVLRLDSAASQETPHESFRLLRDDGDYVMQSLVGEEWKSLYRFDLQPQFLADYEVTNWYLSNYPNSHFLHGLIAARAAPGMRYALRNNELAIHHLHGPTERHALGTVGEIRETLARDFGLVLPVESGINRAIERIAGATASRLNFNP